jgi:O-antigen/teichoic acid export membrane protein
MGKESDNLIRHSILVLALTHTASIANLLFHVVMGRTLPKAEYGILASMLSVTLVFFTPLVAVQNTLAHFAGRLSQEHRAGQIRRLAGSWVRRILLIGTPLLLLIPIFGSYATSALHLPNSTPLLIVACTILMSCLMLVFSGALQGVQSFGWMCIATSSWGIVRLIFGAMLVVFVSATAVSGLAAYAAGMAVSLGLGIAGVAAVIPREPPDGRELGRSDRYFFLSLAALMGFSALMYADMILVKHFFTDPEDYGNYARASTIARTMVFLPQPIAWALFPKVVSDGGRSAADARTLLKALMLACVIIAGSLALCILFPKILLLVLYKESSPTAEMIGLVRFVACAMAPVGLTFLLMNFELAQRRFSCLWVLAACAALLIGGISVFHATLRQAATVLACSTVPSAAILTVMSFRKDSH